MSLHLRRRRARGLSLLEVLVAFLILLVAVLTMVGYVATIHRAASESKNQAVASVEARALLEELRDSEIEFVQAASASGLQTTRTQYLLDGESESTNNEVGREAATVFRLDARANHISSDFYGLVVSAHWEEEGRTRKVVLESRSLRPGR